MLHSKKSQAIVQWYNSLTAKGDVNSLEQFADGSHFYEIVANLQSFLLQGSKEGNLVEESVIFSETSIACNEEVITSVEEETAEGKIEISVSESVNADPFVIKESDCTDTHKKYDAIRKFIDDFYHLESSSLIDYGECQKGKDLELAKVAVFLLSAIVQNLVSSKDEVLYNTTLLEMEVQDNIYECLSLVIGEKDTGENQIKKSELQRILSRAASHKGTPLRKQPSRSTPDATDLSEGVKNVPKRRKERTSFVYENLQDSPLKTLYESPKIQQKADIFRKQSELAKLRSALHNEEEKVMSITLEKDNLNDELEKRKKELEFYKKELQSQREALSEKEEQEKLRTEELKDKTIEAEKFRKISESQQEDIKQLKENNDALQEKVVDLEKKLKQDATTSLINENKNLKDKFQKSEFDNEKKDEMIKDLNEKISTFESDLRKYHEMYQNISASNNRRELRSPNVPKIIYADAQTSRETLERKEKEPIQDLETKDERIKIHPIQHCKGETSKNKNSTEESSLVQHLNARVHSLEREKNLLEKKLENFGSKFGLTRENISLPKDLNSIKKESVRLGSATDDITESSCSTKSDLKMEGQLWANVPVDSQHSYDLSNPLVRAELKFDFEKKTLRSIIKQLERRNCITPTLGKVMKDKCAEMKDFCDFSGRLQDLYRALNLNSTIDTPSTAPTTTIKTRSQSQAAAEEIDGNFLSGTTKEKNEKFNKRESELKRTIENLKASNANLMKEVENLKQEVTITQEKYVNMEDLAKKKNDDVKKALIMYQRIANVNKKDNDSKKVCGDECEKLRRRCKQLNEQCFDFEQQTGELQRSIKNLEGMMEHLRFEIKELKKEKMELQHKLWEETSAMSKNTTDRDALVLHYLKQSKHEPKKNKDLELRKEVRSTSSRPILKVDAYILNSENDPSTSNSVLGSRSIRSSFFQVAEEEDFLNESSIAEIHNGGIIEEDSGDRLQELQRRNTLCPPHLQSSYPLEIQNMTPSERKYYNPEEVSFDLGRESSLYDGEREIRRKPKSKYMESHIDDSNSFPVKKRKISETERISVPVASKHCRPSTRMAKRPSQRQGSTPLKRVAAFIRKQSATFKTPPSVQRLMKLPRKSKLH